MTQWILILLWRNYTKPNRSFRPEEQLFLQTDKLQLFDFSFLLPSLFPSRNSGKYAHTSPVSNRSNLCPFNCEHQSHTDVCKFTWDGKQFPGSQLSNNKNYACITALGDRENWLFGGRNASPILIKLARTGFLYGKGLSLERALHSDLWSQPSQECMRPRHLAPRNIWALWKQVLWSFFMFSLQSMSVLMSGIGLKTTNSVFLYIVILNLEVSTIFIAFEI